ncbi:MAG: aspartate--tRNA ligase [Acidobacteria bacterium]|nr:aspartate--tRNA ligase [Acidobacteriota bacterium]
MQLDPLGDLKRTHTCGELRAGDAGARVTVLGWVQRRRDLGQLIFLDLRDRSGLVQVVTNKEKNAAAHARADQCRPEFVVGVEGTVARREKANPNLETGEIEVAAERLYLLNEARTPPFPIEGEITASEETRLRHRYLDLRRPPLQRKLRLRHRVTLALRRALDEQGFYEIETPFLTRSTPEGARDYLAPSRVHPGHFYALPQSPQLFKQLLMIAGFDRYFQIVRCFRDEDLRADRQPEFTQLDLEMAFATPDQVFAVIEGVMQRGFAAADQQHIETPFPRLTHAQALARYGTDKPDTRFGMELVDVSAVFETARQALRIELPVHALVVPGAASASRSQLDAFADFVKAQKGRALYHAKVTDTSIESALEKTLASRGLEWLQELAGARPGDLILAVPSDPAQAAGEPHAPTTTVIGALRLHVAQQRKLIPEGKWNFLWVTEFPLFEWSPTENRWVSSHHPFTSPADEDMEKLESDPGKVRSKAYDLVLNGWELGSGSVRIHRQDIQQRIFRVLGLSEAEARERFGFFLEALAYGTPPHGGIALGLDRIIALLAGETSLREVIAFPKTAQAQDLMADAPALPSLVQLIKELQIFPRDTLPSRCENTQCTAEIWIWQAFFHPKYPGPTKPVKCLFCGNVVGKPLGTPFVVAAQREQEWREETVT